MDGERRRMPAAALLLVSCVCVCVFETERDGHTQSNRKLYVYYMYPLVTRPNESNQTDKTKVATTRK